MSKSDTPEHGYDRDDTFAGYAVFDLLLLSEIQGERTWLAYVSEMLKAGFGISVSTPNAGVLDTCAEIKEFREDDRFWFLDHRDAIEGLAEQHESVFELVGGPVTLNSVRNIRSNNYNTLALNIVGDHDGDMYALRESQQDGFRWVPVDGDMYALRESQQEGDRWVPVEVRKLEPAEVVEEH